MMGGFPQILHLSGMAVFVWYVSRITGTCSSIFFGGWRIKSKE